MHDDIIDTHNNIINGKKSTQIFFNDFCGFIPSLLIIKAGTPNYCIEEFEYIIKYYFDKEKQVEQPCSIVNTLISKGPEWPEQEVAVIKMKIKYKDEEVDTGDLKWLEKRVTLLERRVQSMCDNYANFMLTFG